MNIQWTLALLCLAMAPPDNKQGGNSRKPPQRTIPLSPCRPHEWVAPPELPGKPKNFFTPTTLDELRLACLTSNSHITLNKYFTGDATINATDITVVSSPGAGVEQFKLDKNAQRIHIQGGDINYIWAFHDVPTSDILIEDVTMRPTFEFAIGVRGTRWELRGLDILAIPNPKQTVYGIWGGESPSEVRIVDCTIRSPQNPGQSSLSFHGCAGLHVVNSTIENATNHTLTLQHSCQDVLVEKCLFIGGGAMWDGSSGQLTNIIALCNDWEHDIVNLLSLTNIDGFLLRDNNFTSETQSELDFSKGLLNYGVYRNVIINGGRARPVPEQESGDPPDL